jgi:acetolactate synthase-1/2/3 large subunit
MTLVTSSPHPEPGRRPESKGRVAATVADAVARTLHAYGVRFAFGIPGNDVLETIRACEEAGIEFVLAKSEPAAAFMADAVYQLTGAPAVLIPALGPGLANAIAGLAGALMERSAMIVLAGEMGAAHRGIYTHQVFDHVALATPVTKWAAQLNPARAAQQTAKALDIALAYPAGPVLLNLAADATRAESPELALPRPPSLLADGGLSGAGAAAARGLLAGAQRPLALIGLGALIGQAPAAVRELLASWTMPALASYKAKGVVDECDPLALGAVGLSPVVDAENIALIGEADLLVLVGFDPIELRDAWVDAWSSKLPVLALDWSAAPHRVFPLGRQAVGDLPTLLRQLRRGAEPAASAWPAERLAAFRERVAHIVRPRSPARGISPAALFAEISDQATPDWLMTVDVGAHRILANHVVRCREPGQLIQSNGLCCMGYAVPAAIGAQLVHPEKMVVALVGDGCMLMSLGELAIAAERGLPIVVVVLDDGALSLIKLKQAKLQMAPRAVDFAAPRFAAIGAGFGAATARVETIEDFAEALRQAVAGRRFTVIDAVIDPAEYMEQM